ncbi:hypothetical protein E6W39_34160 [Kitasatospora acidiphila]|uniref:ATPase n=1 Tax=Kitasatospora acidiphila TaxID=2567942 RepID=A0A540WBB6_9ACTN|nr:hypothetical protein [Kitasatospora acidiphila]TQF06335.1 hypothetical protein E6W39_34160 [Kitasatospora acidiphila]
MTEPRWLSQPFPPEGASAAEGIRNQLGRPELDLLTILVRESAQNSWDARLVGSSEPVDYRIDLRAVGPAHVREWRELLLGGAPTSTHLPLRDSLMRGLIRVMSISDRGTKGLGGPTRADDAIGDDRDFVSFIRNIGEPRNTALGGGTYGFGKGIFYLLSKCGTILVHTRCRTDEDAYETRLIGCAMWKSYVASEPTGKRRYTGRHWWGDASQDVVEPMVGAEADAMARRLGLRPFGTKETGTTIVVIDPNLEDYEPVAAADYLAETMAWHLWPKMIATDDGRPAMRFSIACDGEDRPVPDPRETRPLDMFVAAYEAMRGSNGTDLECRRPKKHLGRLGLVTRIMPPLEPSSASRLVDIEDLVHHVCLMRPAELVVTYHPGPKPPSVHQGYAGVFRADPGMDDVYARAEPPTHDAWNHQSLDHPDSTFVNMTFRRIREQIDGLLSLGGTTRSGAAKVALGAASSLFSGLVGGAWGVGGATDYGRPGSTVTRPSETDEDEHPEPADQGYAPAATEPTSPRSSQELSSGGGAAPGTANGPGSSAPRRRPRVQYLGDPYYDDDAESTLLVQEFKLPVPGRQRVRVELAVVLPGDGRESDPPLGAQRPELVGWQNAAGDFHADASIEIDGSDAVWRAVVRPAPDTMTEIDVKVEAVKTR